MMYRWIGVWILSLIVVCIVAACSSEQKSNGGEDVSPVPQDPIELVFYYPFASAWSDETFARTFGEPIKEKFPHITPNLIFGGNIVELVTAGTQIDVIYVSIGQSPQQVTNVGYHHDITPYITQFNYDLSKLDPMMVEMAKMLADGNGMYGIPVYTNPAAIYYNRDLFDRFGVEYPADYMDWDDLYEVSRRMTRAEADVQYYGLLTSFGHLERMNQLSLSKVEPGTNRVVIQTDEWQRFINNIIRFYKAPGYENLTRGMMGEANVRKQFFIDQTVAMWTNVQALLETDVAHMNWDIAGFPTFKDKPGVGPQPYPVYFYVTSTSKHKEQAFQAIAELTTESYQMEMSKEGNFITTLNNQAVKEAFGLNNPVFRDKNVKALTPLQYAPPAAVTDYNMRANLNNDMIDIARGEKDINTALREATERLASNILTWESQ